MAYSDILCPVDFSDASKNALASAVALARRVRGHVHALHVLPVIGPDEEMVTAERTLAEFVPRELEDVVAEKKVVRSRDPDVAILEAARRLRTDLIVCGTHGRTGWRRALIGSVAERVVKLAPCSVLTVRDRPVQAKAGGARVLCAVDLSPASSAALAVAAEIARDHGELVVIHVVEPVIEPVEYGAALIARRQLDPESLGRVRALVQKHVDAALPSGVHARVGVEIGAPFEVICNRAKDESADLIVLASSGLGRVQRLLLGSCADRVVRLAEAPVLVVKPVTR